MSRRAGPPARRPTIADIAARAGVSAGAVSYALNGRPGVSEATRARVLAVAAEIGWAPHTAARALSGVGSSTVGLVFHRPARMLGLEPFTMEFVSGIEGVLGEAGQGLLLQVVPDVPAEIEAHRRWWQGRRVDGVVVLDLLVDDPRLAPLVELGLPAVVAGDPALAGGLPAVWSDDAGSAEAVVRRLAELGHRRVARICGPFGLAHTAARTRAFLELSATLGLVARVVETDYTGEGGAAATRTLLTGADRPTAVVYDNDVMAVAGLSCAAELGIAVPAELSLVAWDDSVLCRITHPPLSAMRRDVAGFGAAVARRLLAEIAGTASGSVMGPAAELVERGTTAPAPGRR